MYSLFGLEELVKKMSQSVYRDYFIIKGGFLLSSVYGLETRATLDLDTTVRRMKLDKRMLEEFLSFLEQPENGGNQHFKRLSIRETREDFEYAGFKVKLQFLNGRAKIPIVLDITTGEAVLKPIESLEIPLIFESGKLSMVGYSVEQILADKLYTTLSYGRIDDTNSRSKDLYDIYFLTKKMKGTICLDHVGQAVVETMEQRNQLFDLEEVPEVLDSLTQSEYQRQLWKKYQKSHRYAKDISFSQVMDSVIELYDAIKQETIFFDSKDQSIDEWTME